MAKKFWFGLTVVVVAAACGLDTVSGAVIGLGRVGKESRETLLAPESVRQRAKIIAHGRNLGNN